jgi:hypothetical protein
VAERSDLQLNLNRAEDGMRRGPVDPKELPAAENQMTRLKSGITRLQTEEQSLRMQETEMSTQMASDQALWIQINSRLDEFESSSSRR